MVAAWFGNLDIVKLLVGKGAPIDVVDQEERSTLHIATWFGYKQIVQFLVEHSTSSVNTRDKNGNSPLHFACQHNFCEIIELLRAAGADLKLKNKANQTPEQLAEAEDRKEVVELLQKKRRKREKPKNFKTSRFEFDSRTKSCK